MIRYFVTCSRGMEPVLSQELKAIGAADIQPGRGGVHFQGEPLTVYLASLWLRTAVRILRPILEFPCRSPEELYDTVRSIDWAEFMSPERTLAVDCNLRDSRMTHSQYASRKVKDAICDQFRDKCGRRPSVDVEQPSIGLNLHISRDRGILSLDASWDSLHKRGYRPIQSRAPLNEALAAGILLHLGYDGRLPLVDPLCGSGTFPIEAAWIATNRPPGLTRKWFGFFGWPDFDPGLWSAVKDEARRGQLAEPPESIVGSDHRADAIRMAVANAKAAGVGRSIQFVRDQLTEARPPEQKPGWIVCNPPYGERLGEERELIPLYRSVGEMLRGAWTGWKLAVFTASEKLANEIGLPVRRKLPLYNGSLPCQLYHFE